MNLINIVLLEEESNGLFEKKDFLNFLFPNPWDALAIFLAFVILVIAVFYFAYKPVKKIVLARKEYVNDKMTTAENRELESRKLIEDANNNVLASKKEAIQIIEDAKLVANKEKEEILKQAKNEANEEIERAKLEIAQEIESSKDLIHKEIVDVALNASEKVLNREINKKDDEKIVDSFLKDLEK